MNLLFGDEFEHYLAKKGFQSALSHAQISYAIQTVMEEGSDAGRVFLGRLLESYTVLAMLKSTPDVQSALRKAIASDEIWVDTSFLLPALAEMMNGADHPFGSLIQTCNAAGIHLFVTDGVIQEIDTHLWNCVAVVRSISSPPRYPYLIARFIESGNRLNGFPDWQEEIRGGMQPLQDIADYLEDVYGIVRRPLTEEVESAPQDLRIAASEYWHRYHEQRRGGTIDAYSVDRLVEHDVENVVGVIQLRESRGNNRGSYQHWWLTLDRKARNVGSALTTETGRQYDNIAISPGYLAQLIRLTPSVTSTAPKPARHAPMLLDLARSQSISSEIIDKVEELRKSMPNISSRRIRRVIRDELNRQKSDTEVGLGGLA